MTKWLDLVSCIAPAFWPGRKVHPKFPVFVWHRAAFIFIPFLIFLCPQFPVYFYHRAAFIFATFVLPVNSPQGPSQSRPDRKQLQLLRQPWCNLLTYAISLIKQWFMVKLKAALDQCWLPVKLLHHLNLNWVFPRIVQWRFGRDLSWVAYSHLNIRFITEVYTNRERKLYINAKYF